MRPKETSQNITLCNILLTARGKIMTTSFSKSFDVPCNLETLLHLMTDAGCLNRLMESSYAQNPKHSVQKSPDGKISIHIYREFEGEWPSFAQSAIGKTLSINEERVWLPVDGTTCNGLTKIKALNDKAIADAKLSISQNGNTCSVSIAGHIKVDINMLFNKIGEEIIKKEMLEAIDLEHSHYLKELS